MVSSPLPTTLCSNEDLVARRTEALRRNQENWGALEMHPPRCSRRFFLLPPGEAREKMQRDEAIAKHQERKLLNETLNATKKWEASGHSSPTELMKLGMTAQQVSEDFVF